VIRNSKIENRKSVEGAEFGWEGWPSSFPLSLTLSRQGRGKPLVTLFRKGRGKPLVTFFREGRGNIVVLKQGFDEPAEQA